MMQRVSTFGKLYDEINSGKLLFHTATNKYPLPSGRTVEMEIFCMQEPYLERNAENEIFRRVMDTLPDHYSAVVWMVLPELTYAPKTLQLHMRLGFVNNGSQVYSSWSEEKPA